MNKRQALAVSTHDCFFLKRLELSPFHLKETLYSFSLVYVSCQYYYLGLGVIKYIRVTAQSTVWHSNIWSDNLICMLGFWHSSIHLTLFIVLRAYGTQWGSVSICPWRRFRFLKNVCLLPFNWNSHGDRKKERKSSIYQFTSRIPQ